MLVGLPAAASVINFVVLTSAASSANSGVFSTSRMLFGLAQEGVAPKAFAKLSKRAVPAKGLTFSCICLLGGVVMLYVNPSVIGAFTMITNRFRDSVYVRLDDYPLLVPGLPQTASSSA